MAIFLCFLRNVEIKPSKVIAHVGLHSFRVMSSPTIIIVIIILSYSKLKTLQIFIYQDFQKIGAVNNLGKKSKIKTRNIMRKVRPKGKHIYFQCTIMSPVSPAVAAVSWSLIYFINPPLEVQTFGDI